MLILAPCACVSARAHVCAHVKFVNAENTGTEAPKLSPMVTSDDCTDGGKFRAACYVFSIRRLYLPKRPKIYPIVCALLFVKQFTF